MGRLTLILGGARSGKSTFAEMLAGKRAGRVTYIATAQVMDEEMARRIQEHRRRRPGHWRTLEIPTRVGETLHGQRLDTELVLLDCLTVLVSNRLLEAAGAVDEPDEDEAAQAVDAEVDALLEVIAASAASWIVVSNEVGMGLVPPYPLGRLYRDLLGRANRRMADAADEVYLTFAGLAVPLHELGVNIEDIR
jgi:adenosylcobinamide kinase/adenosylcobinamide-phosphate guanylyltransferase